MRDLFLIIFLLTMLLMGLRRPFLLVFTYIYVDIVSPQLLSYYYLNAIPVSLIVFLAAITGWALSDDKSFARPTPRMILLVLLLAVCGLTTLTADFPEAAQEKWSWVWKALLFAIFLPVTLYTRVRIEGTLLCMLLSLSSIAVVGGMKTLGGGGGYGTLNLMISNNSGMYEGSTISTFAICSIPLILFMAKHATLIPQSIFSKIYWYALAFACLLIPIGTQARTGLLCILLLALLQLRGTKRKMLTLAIMGGLAAAAIPFLPDSYTERMNTIQNHSGEASASTRLGVWKWAIEYAKENPFGGGFAVYLGNKVEVDLSYRTEDGTLVKVVGYDESRAFHNSYFEMLGEQGYLGLALFLIIHLTGIFRMERIRRAYGKQQGEHGWVAPLATALQHCHLIYMLGCSFVGIAFQTYIYFLIAVEIALDRYVQTYLKKRAADPFRSPQGGAGDADFADGADTDAPAPVPEPATTGAARRGAARWGSTEPR